MSKIGAFIFLSLIAVTAFAQNGAIQSADPNKEPVIKEEITVYKIKVSQAGKIELNGKPVSLEELKVELVQLKELNGEVWYYSESSKGYPSNQAMKVLRMILDNKIPYKLSIQPDFSDYARVKSKGATENTESSK